MVPPTIFIFSFLGRSGTNFLANLIDLHPDCRLASAPFKEDWFLAGSQQLVSYSEQLRSRYDERGFVDAGSLVEQACRGFGEALLCLLYLDGDKQGRVITKTPSLDGFESFHKFFPSHRAIVLIRDGRSVVESFHKTFGTDRRDVAAWWNKAAEKYLAVKEQALFDLLSVSYEDLVADTESELRRILAYLELRPSKYPFSSIESIPVVGSSVYGIRGGQTHWDPVPLSESFDPLARHAHWTAENHHDFNQIAGSAMEKLGYTHDCSS